MKRSLLAVAAALLLASVLAPPASAFDPLPNLHDAVAVIGPLPRQVDQVVHVDKEITGSISIVDNGWGGPATVTTSGDVNAGFACTTAFGYRVRVTCQWDSNGPFSYTCSRVDAYAHSVLGGVSRSVAHGGCSNGTTTESARTSMSIEAYPRTASRTFPAMAAVMVFCEADDNGGSSPSTPPYTVTCAFG